MIFSRALWISFYTKSLHKVNFRFYFHTKNGTNFFFHQLRKLFYVIRRTMMCRDKNQKLLFIHPRITHSNTAHIQYTVTIIQKPSEWYLYPV